MNKIKKRHLDETLINELDSFLTSGNITYDDLSPELQLKFITGGGTGDASDGRYANILQEHTQRIENLESVKIDLSELSSYVKINAPNVITTKMLDTVTQKQLSQLSSVLSNINTEINNYINTNKIEWSQLNTAVQNRITAPEEKIDNLSKSITAATNEVDSLKKSVALLSGGTEVNERLLTDEELINGLRTDCDSYKLSFETIQNTNTQLQESVADLTDKTESFSTSITNLQNSVSQIPDPVKIQNTIDKTTDIETRMTSLEDTKHTYSGQIGQILCLDQNNTAMVADLFKMGRIARSQEELYNIKMAMAAEAGTTAFHEILYFGDNALNAGNVEILYMIDSQFNIDNSPLFDYMVGEHSDYYYFEAATSQNANLENELLTKVDYLHFAGTAKIQELEGTSSDETEEETENVTSVVSTYASSIQRDEETNEVVKDGVMFMHVILPQYFYRYCKKFFADINTKEIVYNYRNVTVGDTQQSNWITVRKPLTNNKVDFELEASAEYVVTLSKAWSPFVLFVKNDNSYVRDCTSTCLIAEDGVTLTVKNTGSATNNYRLVYQEG